jgi:glutamate 5-kinase
VSGTIVVKIGTSSLTDEEGLIQRAAIEKLAAEVAAVKSLGWHVVVVTSGAIAAGLPDLGLGGANRPVDAVTLQAVSAVGQIELLREYRDAFADHGILPGQVLLAPLDFSVRAQYLHARSTLHRLLELGVVPVVNENDAIADDEIRYGDNDRIAALVGQLVEADLLVLLTDTDGVLTADPRIDDTASLIEEIVEVDHEVEALAGGAGSARGSGGMASKLAAAKMASWAGVRTVIAGAARPNVLHDVVTGAAKVGTVVHERESRLNAWRLWIAFAQHAEGQIVVDAGARQALESSGRSLLAAGILSASGTFGNGDAVEVVDPDGVVFAKGRVRAGVAEVQAWAGSRTDALPHGAPSVIIHRDDLVLLT